MLLEGKFRADQAPLRPDMQSQDPFDRFHDYIILRILNSVGDIKSLGRCTVVCKRFHDLVFLVENVTVKIDCVISGEDVCLSSKGRNMWGQLVRLVVGSFVKPFQALHHILSKKGSMSMMAADVSHHSPIEILKNFVAVKNLKIELPGGELGTEDGILLKWRAEFGSTLESCVILGASSFVEKESKKGSKVWFSQARHERQIDAQATSSTQQDDGGALPESFYTNGGLKLRVVWTISSLIAASARHFLLKQIIAEHPTLVSLVLTDADGQGMLCMCKEQLLRFVKSPLMASAASNRTQIPALNLKLWYAPHLELPGGTALKGATLVAIQPNEQPTCKEVDGFIPSAFQEPFKTAAILLSKRRTYLLEMNAF